MRVGFMRVRSHEVIDIAECPVLAPSMIGTVKAARDLAAAVAGLGKPLDIVATSTNTGLDVELRGLGPIDELLRRRLIERAAGLDLARLSNHGEILVERRTPLVPIGRAQVVPQPGAFLQATVAGEDALAALVQEAVGDRKKVADLFCGIGTFSLRLAERATVHAADGEAAPVAALARAARETPGLRPVTTATRDLFRRPLSAAELTPFDAVVFDPPRAGAEAQARALATSKVPLVVAVSCNPATFARDVALLVAGGFRLDVVTPVDQFRYTPHVEIVGVLRRTKARRARPLLG
jgi:23S rRNA (uracil1939-C5)-methyltransferase